MTAQLMQVHNQAVVAVFDSVSHIPVRASRAGLHSSWVNESIVAMARPWESKLVGGALQELQRLNFGMVLNLQEIGEHAHCGAGILASSGFSYNPETLMAAGIGYYHMCWPDMSTPSLDAITRVVQVK
jgi:protein tyrosine phosphatase domain-containing protein 1